MGDLEALMTIDDDVEDHGHRCSANPALEALGAEAMAPEPEESELQLGPCAICLNTHEDSQHNNAVCQ